MKRFFKDSTDWEKYLGIELSPQQKKRDKELCEQIKQNGIYAVFDRSNSKEEIAKRINERKNKNLKIINMILTTISIIMRIITL